MLTQPAALSSAIEIVRIKVPKAKFVCAHLSDGMHLRNQANDRNILRVTLRDGFRYAIDLTSCQNGFTEKVLPWSTYLLERSNQTKESRAWPSIASGPRFPKNFGLVKPIEMLTNNLKTHAKDWLQSSEVMPDLQTMSTLVFKSKVSELEDLLKVKMQRL
jgi:hypothetical protein